MADQSWLTTGEATRLLGVTPERARQWAGSGRLLGRLADDGTWCLEPASVDQELGRIQRASWWRRDGLSRDQANEARRNYTRRLIEAAVAWRESPDDPDVIHALQAAIDDRRAREVDDRHRRPPGNDTGNDTSNGTHAPTPSPPPPAD